MSNADGPTESTDHDPDSHPRSFGQHPDTTARPAQLTVKRPRERRVLPSTVMIIVAVLIMIAGLVITPLLSDATLQRLIPHPRQDQGSSAPVDPGGKYDGSSGAGDPYYPDYGNGGYDAERYTISLEWIPKSSTLTGSTVISARSSQPLRSFYVDLRLPVSSVTVNGAEAKFERQDAVDVKITPKTMISDNTEFEVLITYGGKPGDYSIGSQTPWWVTGDEVTVAGEPDGAAWWYPSNDHPSDPATFDISVRVPAGLQVISNGRLASRDSLHETDYDTWHWVCNESMSTYQAFIAIGHYQIKQGTADDMPYVYAVSEQLPSDQRQRIFSNLATSAKIINGLEKAWGRYPYGQFGGVVPAHRLWYAGLETATRPVYAAASMDSADATDLITHELAHMWFGDTVTLKQWNDIFDSEAYASFSEWLHDERSGRESADDRLHRTYNRLKDNADFWTVTMADPGRDNLFDAVYTRGPMTLQALRNVMGDKAFFAFSRDWTRGGTESLENWMSAAQSYTSIDLTPFFAAWIYGTTAPARTKANGLA